MQKNSMIENSILLERVFDAEVELVWKTWTEPGLLKLWFGSDPKGTVENVLIDLRIGGAYEISFRDSNLSKHTCRGKFLNIVEHKILVYTWEWESEPDFISELEVNFFPVGEKTKLILEHKNLNPDSKHGYEAGWNGALNKIEKILPTIKH